MSKYGYSLDVGDELEKELQEVESRISQYGKVGKGTKKEDTEEDPLFGTDEDEDAGDEPEERKKHEKKTKHKKEEKTRRTPSKIKIERLEREKSERPQRIKLQTYIVKDTKELERKKDKKEFTQTETQEEKTTAQKLIKNEEESDWVTTIVWIAVILLAGYFVWSYLQPASTQADNTQCAINILSQSGTLTVLNIEKEKDANTRILLRDAQSTPNINEALTYYKKAACGKEQNCTKTVNIVITPQSLEYLGITKPEKCREADNIIACDNGIIIDGATATLGNKAVHGITVVRKGKGTQTVYAETALQSASVYEGKEGLQSITYPRELEGSTIIRMYTRDTLEDTNYKITYESQNPRVVGYTIT